LSLLPRATVAAAILGVGCIGAIAQSPSKASRPQYETAAVHPAPESPPFMGCDPQPARLRCFLNLQALVSQAYSVRYEFVVQGPKWIVDKVWALDATIDPVDLDRVKALTREQRSAMIQGVLADRFGLKVHQEMRVEPVYDLVIANGGHKLQPMAAASDAEATDLPKGYPRIGIFTMSGETARAFGETMDEITKQISGVLGSGQIDRPILNKTGLEGRWNFTLKIAPDGEQSPSPFTVIQEQLGLKLIPAKEPVPVLVIDEANLPTAN
jgi:uncharacterized protein (TIGR03435 family)